jgi:predicted nuclease with TOPRIM domain
MVNLSKLEPLIKDLSEYDRHQVENLFLEMIWDRSQTDFALIEALIATMNKVSELTNVDENFKLLKFTLESYVTETRKDMIESINKYDDNLESMRTNDTLE